jgi:hypothetical protein
MLNSLIKSHLLTIASYVYTSCELLKQTAELSIPNDLRIQMQLLHAGLSIAQQAIESESISEIIRDEDIPC